MGREVHHVLANSIKSNYSKFSSLSIQGPKLKSTLEINQNNLKYPKIKSNYDLLCYLRVKTQVEYMLLRFVKDRD